jgi:hypothetical protein
VHCVSGIHAALTMQVVSKVREGHSEGKS